MIFNVNILKSEIYPTKNYKWHKLSELDGLNDTSFIIYSKIQSASNNKLILGGLGYYTQYERSIFLSNNDINWEVLFKKGSLNTDCIIDSKDRLLIIGNRVDSANFIYMNDLVSNETKKITLVTEKPFVFTRIIEFSENNYLIKANDGYINYLFQYNYLDSSLTQLIPRKSSTDSADIAINKDLQIINDVALGMTKGRILVTTKIGSKLYYSDDLFKTIKVGYYEENLFYRFMHVILGNGRFIYSYSLNDTLAKDPHTVGLYCYNEVTNKKQLLLNHYLNGRTAFNPISMMACSNEKYIVCKMGVTYESKGFGDTLNVDSLMISDNFGYTFKYVPFPDVNADYNYFAFAAPSVTRDGHIILLVSKRSESGSGAPSPFKAEIYYGIPDDVGVMENEVEYSKIYPNPAKDYINLKIRTLEKSGLGGVPQDIKIFDIFGERALFTPSSLSDNTTQEGNLEIDVSKLSPGIYFIKIGTQPPLKFIKL